MKMYTLHMTAKYGNIEYFKYSVYKQYIYHKYNRVNAIIHEIRFICNGDTL